MSDLSKRVLSGVLLAGILLGDLWLGAGWFAGLLLVVGVLVLREWVRLVAGFETSMAARVAWDIAGVAYIALAIVALWALRARPEDGLLYTTYVFLAVWSVDIGAFAVGRAVGGPKIAPAISPSKTWAGLIGGIVGAVLVTLAFGWWRTGVVPASPWALIAATLWGGAIALVAQAGDFFESWMKRRAGVKDSGTMIPGHGGLFDRVDGLLPVAILAGGAAAAGWL